jgi:predicted XRE-type DNA-binding protein
MQCKFDGCDRDAVCKNYCDMHYRRLLRRGDPANRGQRLVDTGDAIERFNKKYIVQENGCWIWTGNKRPNNKNVLYPRHHLDDGKSEGAHRFSYKIFVGEIPAGQYVCHKCDVPLCVNPDHLFLGTHQDNMRDMVQKQRSYTGRGENKKGRAKLTNIQALEIKNMHISQSKIAKIFGVSQATIGRIKRGESY